MKNDDPRHFDVSDAGQNQAIRANDFTSREAQPPRISKSANGGDTDELQCELQKNEEIETFVASLDESEEKQLIHFLVEQREWAGLLPDPNTFNQYPKEVQKSILAWNDATIIDGSKRESELVDGFIRHRKWSQIFSFIINTGIPLAGITAFVLTGDHACLTSLGVPVISIGVNIWKDKREEQEAQEE